MEEIPSEMPERRPDDAEQDEAVRPSNAFDIHDRYYRRYVGAPKMIGKLRLYGDRADTDYSA